MILSSIDSNAQDLHFSQFQYSPLLTNPANTGDFQAEWRFTHNYRSQWYTIAKPFQTQSLSFEKNFFRNTKQYAFGMNLLYDKSGVVGLQIAKVNLSGAYRINFFQKYVNLSAQLGWSLYQYSLNGLTTDSQWDQSLGYFNPSLDSHELNDGQSMNFPVINLGVLYGFKIRNKIQNKISAAVYQLNFPKVGFDLKEVLNPGFSVQYLIQFPERKGVVWTPMFMYRYQTKAEYLLAGADIEIVKGINAYQVSSVKTGLMVRSGFNRNLDAVIVHGGLKFYRTEVGVSYDINVSGLQKSTQYQGAFEIYIVYLAQVKTQKPGAIPCFRQ